MCVYDRRGIEKRSAIVFDGKHRTEGTHTPRTEQCAEGCKREEQQGSISPLEKERKEGKSVNERQKFCNGSGDDVRNRNESPVPLS